MAHLIFFKVDWIHYTASVAGNVLMSGTVHGAQ